METPLYLASHILAITITLVLLVSAIILFIGLPYCKYTFFVSKANTRSGIENLAKYLAKKSGPGRISATDLWQTFIPAASRLGEEHLERREEHLLKKTTQ